MPKRTVLLFAALLFLFSGIILRIFQLTDGSFFEVGNRQSTVTVTAATARGTIYDRHLTPLTNCETQYSASVISTPEALAALSGSLTETEWQQLNKQLQNGKPTVQHFQSPVALAAGITQFVTPIRYSNDQLAAHVIGYLGDDGIHGVSGIEKALDDLLIQSSGSISITYQTDGTGKALQGGETKVENTLSRAKGGVSLTLDSDIQRMVEQVAGENISKGAVVVMEPNSGEIMALASFPDFEPTALAAYLDDSDSPLFNRALGNYNCGSVFKIVSAATALENGVPATQRFTCTGSIPVGNNRIKCHHVLGHGTLDLCGGFSLSCNPYFIQMIQLTGGTPLYRMASSFGLDSPIFLAPGYQTARAVMPTETDLLTPTALANLSFGQGDLMASPVHVSKLTASVINGGVISRPNLLRGTVNQAGEIIEAEDEAPTRVFSQKTASVIYEMMLETVENGSGKSAMPQYGGAGGKTGTAETGWKTKDGDTMVQSWFTGFYPAVDPQYVITVLVEDAGRNEEQSAPVFKKLCDALYRMGMIAEK